MKTLGELKSEIIDWINREDTPFQVRIPIFIRLAEAEIYRNLRCQDNQFIATYTPSGWNIDGGTTQPPTINSHIILPPNYREMTLVKWNDVPLDQISDYQLAARLHNQYDAGTVKAFSITGRKIAFSDAIDPDPSTWTAEASLVYVYYGVESLNDYPTWQVPSNPVENPPTEDLSPQDILQSDGNTTRMLQCNPDAYLHGSLYYACLYLKDREGTAQWGGLFKSALEDLRVESSLGLVAGSTSQVTSIGGTL